MPEPIALPIVNRSGSSAHSAVQPPGPAEIVWVSVDHQQRAVTAGELAQGLVVAGLGQDDAHVRHRRLRQHARHVAFRQRALERVDVVELDRPRGDRRVDCRADVPLAAARAPVSIRDRERLVDGAVVAVRVDEHLRPARYLARDPQRGAVGVGGCEREEPAR